MCQVNTVTTTPLMTVVYSNALATTPNVMIAATSVGLAAALG